MKKNFTDLYEQLQLLEGTDLTEMEVNQVFDRCLAKMEAISRRFDVRRLKGDHNGYPIDFAIDIDGMVATNVLGRCGLGYNPETGTIFQIVTINRLLYKKELIPLLENNIYHEMCHAYANIDGILEDFFIVDENENNLKHNPEKEDRAEAYEGNTGHSTKWFEYVDLVNETLSPSIPVDAHPKREDFDFFMTTNMDAKTMEIAGHAPGCSMANEGIFFDKDFKMIAQADFDLARVIAHLLMGKSRCPECGQEITMEIYDEDLKREVPEFVRFVMLMELRALFGGN